MIEWSPDAHGSFGPITITVSDDDTDSDSQAFSLEAYYFDCSGIKNGDKLLDNCGTCDDDISNDCTQDCAGVWGGSFQQDDCNICLDPTNAFWNQACADCFYIPNGTNVDSDCGCIGPDAGNEGNGDWCDDCFDIPNGTA